jgi:hypothetical protein
MSVLSVQTLKQALVIAEQIEKLQTELSRLIGQVPGTSKSIASSLVAASVAGRARRKPRFSKAARAKISSVQKERWAKTKTKPGKARKKGKMSAAGRANIVRAQKARWAKIRAEKGKKS